MIVGEEKEVVLSDGTSYTVRIANNSPPMSVGMIIFPNQHADL